jgi:3-hydroxyisobutyrate dehydrogenase-like beta-hydroxyacid dehydrogenase
MTTTVLPRVGFIGLGHMGLAMAVRLLDAGYEVYGVEGSRARTHALLHDRMRWRKTPHEIAELVDFVFTSLPDDAVLESVAAGPEGILSSLGSGKIWADMSTVSPRVSRALADRVHAVGAAMLDAPVSGSVPQVRAGALTIMVGGDETAYARIEPILRELGSPTHVGYNGQGLALKLAINVSLAVQMLAFAEGLLLAERAGIDPALAAGIMTQSPMGSPMLKSRAPLVLDLPKEAWFDVRLMQKDLRLALDAARYLRVPLPSTAVADQLLSTARDLGYEDRDIAVLFRVLSELDVPPANPAAETP